MWNGHLGRLIPIKHRIDLTEPGKTPIHQSPYRAGPLHRKLEKTGTNKILAEGIIEPVNIEWESPISFAFNKDGALFICVDYQKLNSVNIRDSHPMPRKDKRLDFLGGAKVLTALHANAGNWQIEMDEYGKDNISFFTHFGLFRYKVLFFLEWKRLSLHFNVL